MTQCYKYLEFGYIQSDCKGPQKKGEGISFRYGEKDHKRAECRKERNAVCSAPRIT